jgi:hypothetical protein
MISVGRLSATALVAGMLISIAMPANASLAICQGRLDAVGRGPTPTIAFDKAKFRWSLETINTYGFSYAKWANAKDRVRSCKTTDGITYCRVHAEPCTSAGPAEGVNKKPVYN